MAVQNVVVIGGSSGGIEALKTILSNIHPGVPASLLVAIHIPATPSLLAHTLDRIGNLPVEFAQGGEMLEKGRVLLAPPDSHLLLDGNVTKLSRSARENGFRPAIDPLFRSAAQSAGPRVAGVILSGLLDDGTAGLRAVKRRGGTSIVQDFNDALFPDLPLAAARGARVDYVLPAEEIAAQI